MNIAPSPEHKVLTALLFAISMQEAMEAIQGTEAYSREVKMRGNPFLQELTKYTSKLIPLVWGIKDDVFYTLLRYQEQIIKKIIELRPEDIDVLLAFI